MEPGPGACPSLFPEPWGFWNPWPWTRDPLDWHLVWGSLKGGWGPPDLQRRCGVVSPCAALQWGEEQEAAASCVGAANVCQGR